MDVRFDSYIETGTDTVLPGHVCRLNADCDDMIPCTDDICDSTNRCLNIPNSTRCDDGVYCNGQERCDTRRGCIRGAPVSCDDNFVCTEDRCVEETHSCTHLPLDRDHDGDPDEHCHALECGDAGVPEPDAGVPTPCWRGQDCDDLDPTVNSLVPPICGSPIDHNCDGIPDSTEPGCVRAPHDRCDSPLDVSAGGDFTLDLSAAQPDYTFPCAGGVAHDVVAVLHLTMPQDVDIRGSSTSSIVALVLQSGTCGMTSGSNNLGCSFAFPAVVRRHSLPAGDYYIIVGSTGPGSVDLTVRLSAATPAPTNTTCATAEVVPLTGATYHSDLIGVPNSVNTTCGGNAPNTIYTFTLTAPMDVTAQLAAGRTDFLNLSLTSDCGAVAHTLRCDSGSTVSFTAHQLAAGTYFLIVQGFDPIDYTLQVSFNPPTPPPPGDTCANPLTLNPGTPITVSSTLFENDYRLTCTSTGRDTVFQFTLTAPSDVMVDTEGGVGSYFGVSIAPNCPPTMATERTCTLGSNPQAFALGLDPGTYFVVTKPNRDTDYQVTLNVYPPITATAVSGNGSCANAFPIPPGRGYFTGDTSTLTGHYPSPCAGSTPAPAAVFRLHVPVMERVTVVLETSFFNVMWISDTSACPGTAPMTPEGNTCTLGMRSTLSNTLAAGDYYIFVTGLSSGGAGSYGLLVQPSM